MEEVQRKYLSYLTIYRSEKSEAALFIGPSFEKGRSGESETFENTCLASAKDFNITDFEVWGFDSI